MKSFLIASFMLIIVGQPFSQGSNLVMDETQVTAAYFATGRAWVNYNGDWSDADGVMQGNNPYATLPTTGVFTGENRELTADVTALVLEWINNGNRGLLLRGGLRRFASRNNPDTTIRPYIDIDGVRHDCFADCELDGGCVTCLLGERPTIDVYSGENEVQKLTAQFDLAGVTSVTKATLHIWCVRSETGDNERIFLLQPPAGADGEKTVMAETTAGFNLEQNHPNPFNPATIISYSVPLIGQAQQRVCVQVLDTRGRMVATLINAMQGQGLHQAVWNGNDDHGKKAASGIYVIRLGLGNREIIKNVVMVK